MFFLLGELVPCGTGQNSPPVLVFRVDRKQLPCFMLHLSRVLMTVCP